MGHHPPFLPAQYIRLDADLKQAVSELSKESLLAVDTESNSLHAYRERVCLIQVSTRTKDFIFDPLYLPDLQPLGRLLENPAITKVFHAAEYDLICIKRDFGFAVTTLFDTMLAARISGRKAVGLGALLEEFLGVTADKSHQRVNWGKRPLSADSLLYAQSDTHYLPLLYDRLRAELIAANRLSEAYEAFDEATRVPLVEQQSEAEAYWRISIPNRLSPRQTAVFRELYLLREQIAEQNDVPPFKVWADRAILSLARKMPHTMEELLNTDFDHSHYTKRNSERILEAIALGERSNPPLPPPLPVPADPAIVARYTALREWRKLRAQARGVESDVIISKEALWAVAERMPVSLEEMTNIDGLGPWRLEAYGQELLELLKPYRKHRK